MCNLNICNINNITTTKIRYVVTDVVTMQLSPFIRITDLCMNDNFVKEGQKMPEGNQTYRSKIN